MKKLSAKFLCVVLSLVVLLCALPVTVYAEGTTVIDVGSAQELTSVCSEINQNGGEYTINLTADIEGGYIGITNSNAEVTIFGNGHKIDRSQTVGTAIYAKDGATINLGSADGKEKNALTIVGSNDDSEPGIIEVWPDSTCHMYDNVTLKDHKGCNYLGGGVTVEGGTFVMNGGTIENCGIDGGSVCYGGGVAVLSNGTFIMDDGVITECYVNSNYIDYWDPNRCFTAMGGGVFVTAGSVFTMNGGTISNCEATNFGGGVAMVMLDTNTNNSEFRKMGMGYPQSIVTINGGTITGNSADNGAGVFASGYFYSYASGVAYTLPESGSTAQPGLYINGSTISNNKADDMGGGILIAMLRAKIKAQIHNAEIKNNTADNGAGIENFGYWTQMDIDGCTITGNTAVTKGGGIMLSTNSSGGYTNLKNTTITGNTSGDRGAGVYYDANSEIRISGADVIQNNEFNGKLNNLNVYSLDKPVKVIGELTGSQIGLSDPTLWDDGKEDTASDAVSTDYLTSGYKANNPNLAPSSAFTSDHERWFVGYSDVNTNEVRLVRKKPNYHINNDEIDDEYNNNDIFTSYVETAIGKEIKVGETIGSFYTIPEVKATESSSCPYIFKGWYYDPENDNDDHPVKFGTDKYAKDIYAHWIKVEGVAKDDADENGLPQDYTQYGGFDLAGIQISEGIRDTNFSGHKKPGGLRFITSLSMDVVKQINSIKPDNIEYGYVAATHEGWIKYHKGAGTKLQYVSEKANGINTSGTATKAEDYFDFASNINCTSKHCSSSGVVKDDHRNFGGYLLYTLVITYEDVDDAMRNTKVLARPYIHYTDANGLERVAYSEYRGNSNTIGGCYISYNDIH